ncbi:methyltransferase domain-containing protein [Endozoicomonas sp. SM1973]|uniref:Arsenite methyltransferase n=1 Tax=Spartinivicinus marinus TaxID=2994442 RepID=A0A853I8C8_9GAMM|nr:methyltransferase domain-containing protein [Spartinivicinus marinus]MCX4027137.1 methyltransferase domain-containing protein [Spartinivicinus marinus]NYZ66141.1 methyltransferase domain-containing protein [Spartinivicinus marinus]
MHQTVKNYYGKVLQNSQDLKTNACTTDTKLPPHIRQALANVHETVLSRYYGCGLVAPEGLTGCKILDLGCGSGRDCYVLAQLAGESGHVSGVDMTDEQLAIASQFLDYHQQQFGFKNSNVAFYKGYIENLAELNFAENSFDIIISNCVINLSPDKESVLKQAYRLLKPGGEMYFADVYADRRISPELIDDPILYGECLSGALYWQDFLTIAKQAGFIDPRLVSDRVIKIEQSEIKQKLASINFYSATYRLFKLPKLDSNCEDYGQAVIYNGSIPYNEEQFVLDKHHIIETGKVFPVCGNTWRMLAETRFQPYFQFIGDFSKHYGAFEGCGITLPFAKDEAGAAVAGCC